jgi:hypothetical protein
MATGDSCCWSWPAMERPPRPSTHVWSSDKLHVPAGKLEGPLVTPWLAPCVCPSWGWSAPFNCCSPRLKRWKHKLQAQNINIKQTLGRVGVHPRQLEKIRKCNYTRMKGKSHFGFLCGITWKMATWLCFKYFIFTKTVAFYCVYLNTVQHLYLIVIGNTVHVWNQRQNSFWMFKLICSRSDQIVSMFFKPKCWLSY